MIYGIGCGLRLIHNAIPAGTQDPGGNNHHLSSYIAEKFRTEPTCSVRHSVIFSAYFLTRPSPSKMALRTMLRVSVPHRRHKSTKAIDAQGLKISPIKQYVQSYLFYSHAAQFEMKAINTTRFVVFAIKNLKTNKKYRFIVLIHGRCAGL
jgi:hypothetical protein